MNPRKVTLPGILVTVSIEISPPTTSPRRPVMLEANSSAWSVSLHESIADPLEGTKPGYMSVSPTSFPLYSNTLFPPSCLKLARFLFSTWTFRSRVTLICISMSGKETRGLIPSKVADTSWVLGSLVLNKVKAKMITTTTSTISSNSTAPVTITHTLLLFSFFCDTTTTCSWSWLFFASVMISSCFGADSDIVTEVADDREVWRFDLEMGLCWPWMAYIRSSNQNNNSVLITIS